MDPWSSPSLSSSIHGELCSEMLFSGLITDPIIMTDAYDDEREVPKYDTSTNYNNSSYDNRWRSSCSCSMSNTTTDDAYYYYDGGGGGYGSSEDFFSSATCCCINGGHGEVSHLHYQLDNDDDDAAAAAANNNKNHNNTLQALDHFNYNTKHHHHQTTTTTTAGLAINNPFAISSDSAAASPIILISSSSSSSSSRSAAASATTLQDDQNGFLHHPYYGSEDQSDNNNSSSSKCGNGVPKRIRILGQPTRNNPSSASSNYCNNNKAPATANQAQQVRKLGQRISALQQLVSPFGKTDTASVLSEAIGYIKFLQEQVHVLSSPYRVASEGKECESVPDLRSRGLCLVPISSTENVANNNNGADYWISNVTADTCNHY